MARLDGARPISQTGAAPGAHRTRARTGDRGRCAGLHRTVGAGLRPMDRSPGGAETRLRRRCAGLGDRMGRRQTRRDCGEMGDVCGRSSEPVDGAHDLPSRRGCRLGPAARSGSAARGRDDYAIGRRVHQTHRTRTCATVPAGAGYIACRGAGVPRHPDRTGRRAHPGAHRQAARDLARQVDPAARRG